MAASARPAPSSRSGPQRLLQFFYFAGLSGLGWLLDASLLLGMVALLDVRPAYANVASSCTAALTVFLLSRQKLFRKASRHFALRVAFYVSYTLAVVLIASVAVQHLVDFLLPLLSQHGAGNPALAAAAAAKVLVTPPQLLMNFFMARFVSERGGRHIDVKSATQTEDFLP